MSQLTDKTILVAGGTGNIGGFIVRSLLRSGATVVVPSRSAEKIDNLRAFLADAGVGLDRLESFTGDVGTEAPAQALREEITREVGPPDAVVATLGRFVHAPSLLDATVQDSNEALQGYLLSHFVVARTFLPTLAARGGTYVFINGPLALAPWKGSGAGLVSVATAGQQMLFRALAQELDGSSARVVELIIGAFVRNRETQPSSPVPAEAVGESVADLIVGSDPDVHGRTIQMEAAAQVQ